MKKLTLLTCLIALLAISNSLSAQTEEVSSAKIWEEDITLPTYLTGEEGKNPRFYFGRAYQGAQGRVYPYPIREVLTDVRVDKTYRALNLENEFVKASIIPEIGGKLFTGLDKTNDYDFIYKQSAVKPVLIGMLGAWISGGIEWNVFHHHRATSFTPVDYIIEENPDGSVTAWVGEIELRHRMKWRVGVTVHPGKSYFETTMIAYNRSPLIHSMLYFTNAGVHSNKDYQVIFPPSTEWVTQHAKREYAGWPIAHETYNGVDFTELGKELGTDGTDISLWKNNFKQISYFAYNYEDDWMVGYDHGKDAGTAIIGDNYTVPGKKFWTTGSGDRGKVWDQILTDGDGPELELMAGGYSDNEPDYAWIQPGETKRISQYFYPVRNMMGDVKNANIEAAVNLEIEKGNQVLIAFNSTSMRKNAIVRLHIGAKLLLEETIDIDPDKPYNKKFPLPANFKQDDIIVSLHSEEGLELISYSPKKTSPGAFPGYSYEGDLETGTRTPMPKKAETPKLPSEIETNELLYLIGMRLEQFYNPSVDPIPYYEEALKRDAGDQRVNTAMGILLLKKGMFEKAKEYLTKAVQRTNWNYTHARNAEAFYYLGLALKYTGQYKEAYDALYYATWDKSFKTPGYYSLAEIACLQKNYQEALNHLEGSLANEKDHLKAKNLKATVLRKTGDAMGARDLAEQTMSEDPLDFWSRNELQLSLKELKMDKQANQVLNTLDAMMRDEVNSYLELAVDYGNCGLWDESIEILQRLIAKNKEQVSTYPLLYYYTAFSYDQKEDKDNAAKYYKLASEMPSDYCFPYQLEMIQVLKTAMAHNPKDELAPYYLGNLLYDFQPEEATRLWENSEELGTENPTVYRNLGLAYDKNGNEALAMKYYEKAVAMNPKDSRVIFELEDLYKTAQEPLQKRLDMLQKYHDNIVKSDYLLPIEREVELYVSLGQYEKALDMLKPFHFTRWEGRGNVYTSYVDANLLQGVSLMNAGQFDQALVNFKAAGEYPLSMEAAKPWTNSRTGEVLCYTATLYETMGDNKKTKKVYTEVLNERLSSGYKIPHYYRGFALKKLGRTTEAQPIFEGLIQTGERQLQSIESTSGMNFFAKFGDRLTDETRMAEAHYLIGLGMLGLDKNEEAITEFEKAAALDINHVWSRAKLAEVK